MIRSEGFDCVAFAADVTRESDLAQAMKEAHRRWGSLDILHNNVGVSLAGGDADLLEITEEAFDNIYRINLRGTVFACKHAVAIMREQRSGAIVNVSSAAAVGKYPYVAYKATKAGVVALTAAIGAAERAIRIARQLHPAGAHQHADGCRHEGAHVEPDPRAGAGRTDCKGAARPGGHGLGRGQRGTLPRVGRSQLRHRGVAARGRRTRPEHRLKGEITTRPSYASALTAGVLRIDAPTFSSTFPPYRREISAAAWTTSFTSSSSCDWILIVGPATDRQ